MESFMSYWFLMIFCVVLVIIIVQILQEIYGFIMDSSESQENIILKFIWETIPDTTGKPYDFTAGGAIFCMIFIGLCILGPMIGITMKAPIIMFLLYLSIALVFAARFVVRINTKLTKLKDD